MKGKIGTAQHQQDNHTNLMTQKIEIQSEMQPNNHLFFQSYESKKAGAQMFINN